MSSRRIPVEFTWYHYYEAAKQFFDDSANNTDISEALLRSTISRAYYAIHCLARNYLLEDPKNRKSSPPKEKKKMHKWVIDEFRTNPKISKVHTQLTRLRDDRIKADYNDSVKGIMKMAEGALICAHQAITDLEFL